MTPANHWCCVGACVRCEKGRLAVVETPTLLAEVPLLVQAAGGEEGAPVPL